MFSVLPASLISSIYTVKNSSFARLTNKHSQCKTFSQPCSKRTFSNCFSHNGPARVWSYKFFSRRTAGSSILDHDLGHLCFGRRIQMSGHSDFGKSVHDLCGCHFRCWRSMFSEHCIRIRIIFYSVTSEYDPSFVLLILKFQLRILEMIKIHQ